MGTALMLRENRHFRFTAIAAKFKGKLFWANEMICMLILLGISLLMLVHGAQLTQKFWTWHFTSLSSVSLGWAWALPAALRIHLDHVLYRGDLQIHP